MRRSGKIVVGVFTLWPIIYAVLFISFIVALVFVPSVKGSSESNDINSFTVLIFLLHGLTIFTVFGLLVFYIIHIMTNTRLESVERLIWIIVIIMVGFVAMPIYWYVHVLKDGTVELFRIKSNKI